MLKLENQYFYLLSLLTVLAGILAAVLIYLEQYIPGSALVFGSIGFYRLSKQEEKSTGRTRNVKAAGSFVESFREIAVLSPILVLPLVPKELSVGVLFAYGFQKIFRGSLEDSTQQNFYPLIDPSWRIGLLGGALLGTWYNPFILYWTAWTFLGIYLLELLQLSRQVFGSS